MRKVALASALTLCFAVGAHPASLSSFNPGTAVYDTGTGASLPIATTFEYPVGDPAASPVFGSWLPNGYEVTQGFNTSCDPSLHEGYYWSGQYFCGHTGTDLSDRQAGGIVRATASGMVVFAGYNSSYGEMVRIQHLLLDGSYIYSQYEHLLYGSIAVWPHEIVTIGQQIGLVGNTGFVTGAHLHFEIKAVNEDGVGYTFGNNAFIAGYYDPLSFVADHRAVATATATEVAATATALPLPSATDAPPLPSTIITPSVPAAAATVTSVATAALSMTAPLSATAALTGTDSASATGEHQAVLASFYKRYHDYVTVTVEHLNVHSGSGYQYAPINSVDKGARLGYLGMTGDGWIHVALPSNVYGYVVRQMVDGAILPPLPSYTYTLTPHARGPVSIVVDTRYPARSAPRMSAAPLEPLWVGEKLLYLGSLCSWDKVALPTGRIGYVLNWFVHDPKTRIDLSPTVTPVTKVAVTASTVTPAHTVAAAPVRRTQRPVTAALAPAHRSVTPAAKRPVAATSRSTAASVQTSGGPVVVTTVDGLNLRLLPSLKAAVLEALPRGTQLALRRYLNNWVAVVAPDGARGYVSSAYIRTVGAVTTSSQPGATVKVAVATTAAHPRAVALASGAGDAVALSATVSVTSANLRNGPDLHADVIASEPQGTRLVVRGSQGAWVNVVTASGQSGWMMRRLLDR